MLSIRNYLTRGSANGSSSLRSSVSTLDMSRPSVLSSFAGYATSSQAKKPVSKELAAKRQLQALPPSLAPKRPPNAYALFLKRNFEKIASAYLGPSSQKASAVSKKLSELWKTASEATKKEYTAAANDLKEKYNSERSKYEANITPSQALVEQQRRRLKRSLGKVTPRVPSDPNRPKSPQSSFILFVKAVYSGGEALQKRVIGSSLAALPIAERGKLLGTAWRSLSASEKKKYEDEAAKEKEAYKKAIVVYNSNTAVTELRKELQRDLRAAARGPVKPKTKRRVTGSRRPLKKKVKARKPKAKVVKKVKKAATATKKVKKPLKSVSKKTAKKPTAKKTVATKKR